MTEESVTVTTKCPRCDKPLVGTVVLDNDTPRYLVCEPCRILIGVTVGAFVAAGKKP